MITNNRFIRALTFAGAAIVLALTFAACSAGKKVEPGSAWTVTEITELGSLTISEGATVTAPEGKSLSMTVDGVETGIAPGTYKGKIVLTPADNVIVKYNGMGVNQDYHYRAAIVVEDGKYVAAKSVASAATVGTVTDTEAKDVKITSVGDSFNGIIVRGDAKSSYSIINPVISLTGNGTNDFAGFGAGIMTDGNAEVTVDNAKINNTGAVRTAIWVGGNSVTKVNNSEIETHSGTLPKDYSWSWAKGGPTDGKYVMMEVPWMLGIIGNNRATTVVGGGTAYYNNSHIKVQNWGALSTDAVRGAKLFANKSHIEAVESGYGAYADGADDSFSGCTFDVHDYGLIIAGGTGHFTDATVVNSGRFGVMSHSGSGTITIDKGSVFNTKKAVIQIKGGQPTVVVDDAKLNSEKGIILEAIVNDDPNRGGGGPGGGGAGGARGGMPGGGRGEARGGAPSGAPGVAPGGGPGGAPGGAPGGMRGGAGGSGAVTATFKNVTLNGDIITSMTALSDVVVNLEKTAITGAITTATAKHAVAPDGEALTMKDETNLYYLIGEVEHTYAETKDKYGMKVTLDPSSSWIVSKTSYLNGLTIAEGAKLTAPEGYNLTMTVDGSGKKVGAGSYKGKIVLKVSKIA
jgi:hypothetical protein